MFRWSIFFLSVLFFTELVDAADRIVTRANKIYKGRVVKIVKENYVIRLEDGGHIALPATQIAKIYHGNRLLDFEEGMGYLIQKKYPYLPFGILSIASGAYAVDRYREYEHRKAEYEKEKKEQPDVQNLRDDSGKALAESLIFGAFSVGTLYFALHPLEVKVPIGKIKVGAAPNGQLRLSLGF